MIRWCGSVGETAAPHGFGIALPFVAKAAVTIYGYYPADSNRPRGVARPTPKAAESLKVAGKWTLDVSTKTGTSLAAEALEESIGMK